MKKITITLFLVLGARLFAFEPLAEEYLVSYGNKDASLTITQYYSFTCPHCIALFRKQFQQIRQEYIDTEKVCWVFHPVPMDILTVKAMDCLQKLSNKEKQLFLEVLLEEVVMDNPHISSLLMQKGMEILGKPTPNLGDKEYLSSTDAFLDAFEFIKQDQTVEAVPSVDVNGHLLEGQVPDLAFIHKLLLEFGEKK